MNSLGKPVTLFITGFVLFGSAALNASSPFGDFASKQKLTYEGTWLNTTFGSTDDVTVELELDGYDYSATTYLAGNVFGIGINLPLAISGTIDEDLVSTLETTMPIYGAVEITFDFSKSPGEISAVAVPSPEEVSGIASGTETATFDFIDFDATFEVNFTAGSPAAGQTTASLVEEAPSIRRINGDKVLDPGEDFLLAVLADGSLISVQWYEGPSGDTSNPIPGADDNTFLTPPLQRTTSYWARVTNHTGQSVDSRAVNLEVDGPLSTLFQPSANDPEGFHQSPWFGWLYIVDTPWYYHYQHQYLYTVSLDESSVWIYDFQLGWYWTNASTYPVMSREDGTWLRYVIGSSNPRWFYDYSLGDYMSLPARN